MDRLEGLELPPSGRQSYQLTYCDPAKSISLASIGILLFLKWHLNRAVGGGSRPRGFGLGRVGWAFVSNGIVDKVSGAFGEAAQRPVGTLAKNYSSR